MKYIKATIAILTLTPVFILALLNIIFCGTDVVYISSDGKWSERQMIYRNPQFKDIVAAFEDYKIKCNAPDVTLERLRSKPEWIVLNSWINNQNDIKEKVALSSKFLEVNFGFSTTQIKPAACYKNIVEA